MQNFMKTLTENAKILVKEGFPSDQYPLFGGDREKILPISSTDEIDQSWKKLRCHLLLNFIGSIISFAIIVPISVYFNLFTQPSQIDLYTRDFLIYIGIEIPLSFFTPPIPIRTALAFLCVIVFSGYYSFWKYSVSIYSYGFYKYLFLNKK